MSNNGNRITIRSSAAEYLIFIAATGESNQSFEMRYVDENIWLTQKMLAELYDVRIATINEHIKKIFADAELDENAVIRKFLITATDGKNYNTKHYNLQERFLRKCRINCILLFMVIQPLKLFIRVLMPIKSTWV